MKYLLTALTSVCCLLITCTVSERVVEPDWSSQLTDLVREILQTL